MESENWLPSTGWIKEVPNCRGSMAAACLRERQVLGNLCIWYTPRGSLPMTTQKVSSPKLSTWNQSIGWRNTPDRGCGPPGLGSPYQRPCFSKNKARSNTFLSHRHHILTIQLLQLCRQRALKGIFKWGAGSSCVRGRIWALWLVGDLLSDRGSDTPGSWVVFQGTAFLPQMAGIWRV